MRRLMVLVRDSPPCRGRHRARRRVCAGLEAHPAPITVVVPWPAGGASDTTGRMIAGQMEQTLGQRMVIVNTPGGAGAIGTKEVWDRPHDGYTLTANATASVVSYAVLGRMEQTHRDWTYYLPDVHTQRDCREARLTLQDG